MSTPRLRWRVIGFWLGILVLPWMFPLLGIVALNAMGASIDVSDPSPALESPGGASAQVDAGEGRDASQPHAAVLHPQRGASAPALPGAVAPSHR